MIYGIAAALGWGFADFTAAVVSRRLGSFRTLVVVQATGVVALTILLVLARPVRGDPGLGTVALLLGMGVFYALTYLSFYRALELGPVALVSPITAAFSAIVILLAVVIADEVLRGLTLGGVVVTLVGGLMVTVGRRARGGRPAADRAGVPLAVVALVGFGITAFTFGYYAKEVGWFLPAYLGRIGMTVALLAALPLRRERSLTAAGLPTLAVAVAVGLMDNLAFAAYARGAELGLISIVAAAAATYPVVPVIGGVALLGERLRPHQVGGVVLVVAGLVLLALRQ